MYTEGEDIYLVKKIKYGMVVWLRSQDWGPLLVRSHSPFAPCGARIRLNHHHHHHRDDSKDKANHLVSECGVHPTEKERERERVKGKQIKRSGEGECSLSSVPFRFFIFFYYRREALYG